MADRGDLLEMLPAAPKCLVKRDVFDNDALLGKGVLILQIVQLPLRIQHVKEVGQPALVSLARKAHCLLRGGDGLVQARKAPPFGSVIAHGVVHFLDSDEHRTAVVVQQCPCTQILNFDQRIEGAEIDAGQ